MMVEDMDWLPVEEQVAPVIPPLLLPVPDELLDDEELELDEEEELLELDEELLDDEVEPAYEHHAEPGKLLLGKLLLEQATLLVKVP